ncbi:MAG: LURP-one-related/scramblase family protein [Candidatus Odinarchaeota archaeon]
MKFEERREFLLKEKLVSLRDIVRIMDPEENIVGNFIRKILSIRAFYRLKDLDEKTILIIRKKIASIRSAYKFFEPDENDEPDENKFLGKMVKKIVTIKPKYWIENPLGERLFNIKGTIWGLKYSIFREGTEVARISKKFWRIRDTYGLKIEKTVDDKTAMMLLAIVIVLQHEKEEAEEARRKQHLSF